MYEFYYQDEKPIPIIDGELNPSYFRPLEPERLEIIEQVREKRRKQIEKDQLAKEQFKKLYPKVKDLVLRLKNGKVIIFNLKDLEHGWRIRWIVRELLRDVFLKSDI